MNLLSFFSPQTLGVFPSDVNKQIKLIEYFGKKTVYVDEAPQSGGEIEMMWGRVIKKTQNLKIKVENCLILGLGGGDAPRFIRKKYPLAKIYVIELDPVMVKISQKFFGMDKYKIHCIADDALRWVEKHKKKEKFDLIVVDLFIGKLNPPASRSEKYLRSLKSLLSGSGVILYNAHVDQEDAAVSFKQSLPEDPGVYHLPVAPDKRHAKKASGSRWPLFDSADTSMGTDSKEYQVFEKLVRKVFTKMEIVWTYPYNRIIALR